MHSGASPETCTAGSPDMRGSPGGRVAGDHRNSGFAAASGPSDPDHARRDTLGVGLHTDSLEDLQSLLQMNS